MILKILCEAACEKDGSDKSDAEDQLDLNTDDDPCSNSNNVGIQVEVATEDASTQKSSGRCSFRSRGMALQFLIDEFERFLLR